MPDFRDQMLKHIRFARKWLEQAEHAYDGDSKIRAELKLMLAQAEMKHAREAGKARYSPHNWFWPAMAGSLVILLAVVIVGGHGLKSGWKHSQNADVAYHNRTELSAVEHDATVAQLPGLIAATVQTPAVENEPVIPIQPLKQPSDSTAVVSQQRPLSVIAVADQHMVEPAPTVVGSVVSKDELKQLIRTADRSLKAVNSK